MLTLFLYSEKEVVSIQKTIRISSIDLSQEKMRSIFKKLIRKSVAWNIQTPLSKGRNPYL